MEQRLEDNVAKEGTEALKRSKQEEIADFLDFLNSQNPFEEPKKSGKGNYERKSRGNYKKHKLDKKITVKHFLNQRVNLNKVSKKESEYMDSSPLHPIYVQIIFNGKNTTIKSTIDEMFSSQENFDEFMSDDYYTVLLDREKRFIEYFVKSYCEGRFESEKDEFNKDLDENEIEYYFYQLIELKDIMIGFDYYDHEIIVKVDRALKAELLNFAKEITLIYPKPIQTGLSECDKQELIEERMYEFRFINNALEFPEKNISASQLLNYYEQIVPHFREFRNKFSSQIWNFNIYYSDFVDNYDSHYGELGATIADFLYGDFKQSFLEHFTEKPKIAQSIIKDIETFNKNGTLKNLFFINYLG